MYVCVCVCICVCVLTAVKQQVSAVTLRNCVENVVN